MTEQRISAPVGELHTYDTHTGGDVMFNVNVADEEGTHMVEMLRITPTGFYVRGVKAPTGDGEAKEVYEAFLAWLANASRSNTL